ncbi:MAG: hypothetical protein ACT4P6_20900 [Gemmatimonadaceae bacterium]
MTLRYTALAIVAALAGATNLAAQVGHLPQRSPYRDIFVKHALTYFAGYYSGGDDPGRVAPNDGPMIGARYAIRLGGPIYFTGRLAGVFTDRLVVDPSLPPAQRLVGTTNVPLLFSDAGFDLVLTGSKSWHSLAPALNASVGVAADLSGKIDKSQFRVGVPFMLSYGPSLRFVPGDGKWSWRLDLTDQYFRIRYPESFFLKTGPDSTYLPPDGKRTLWRHNWAMTLGVSVALFR